MFHIQNNQLCLFQNTGFYFGKIITWPTQTHNLSLQLCRPKKHHNIYMWWGWFYFIPNFWDRRQSSSEYQGLFSAERLSLTFFFGEKNQKTKNFSPLSIYKLCGVCAWLSLSLFNLAVHSFTLRMVTNWKANDLRVINVESGNTRTGSIERACVDQ